jgi:hypothetical protein
MGEPRVSPSFKSSAYQEAKGGSTTINVATTCSQIHEGIIENAAANLAQKTTAKR